MNKWQQEWENWKDNAAKEGINPVKALLVAIPIALYLTYYFALLVVGIIQTIWEVL